jgi:phytoene dehydrogenase-like protein
MHQIVEDSSVSVALRMLSLSVAEEPSAKFESLAGMNLMTALVRSVDGAYTVPGGFPVLRRSLTRIISAAGGAVFTNAPVSEIVLNETNARTTGVRIAAQGAVPVELELRCGQGIISGAGALATLTRLLPLSVSSPALTAARQKLKGLEEQRPKMAVVFWLRGSRDALGLSSCELVKLDASSEEEAGQGSSSTSTCRVWSPSARDETWDQR